MTMSRQSASAGPDDKKTGKNRYLKLEIFIPEAALPALQAALQRADAGHIGNYDSCLSWSPVTSTWRPLEGTNPYIGTAGALSTETELKAEVTIREEQLADVMAAVREVHPYEEPVVNVIPLYCTMMEYLREGRSLDGSI